MGAQAMGDAKKYNAGPCPQSIYNQSVDSIEI